jgi:hypothetical protein
MGATVVNAYNPTVDWGTRIVSRFYLYKNGLSYEANGTTGQVVEYAKPQGLLYMGGDVITPANNDVWMLTSALDYPGDRLVKLAPVANVAPLVTLPVPFRIGVDDTTY